MILRVNAKKINLQHFFFYCGVFFKQFYIFPSGNLQIGDICFMLSFAFSIPQVRNMKFGNNQKDTLLIIYLTSIFTINGVYWVLYQSADFLFSSAYYLYCYIVVLTFRANVEDVTFLEGLQNTLKISILSQVVIYLCSVGRWYTAGRYMGTFNDPNQYAFYIFSASLLLYGINRLQSQRFPWLWIAIMVWMIMASASTGMALGGIVFLFGIFFFSDSRKRKKVLSYFLLSVFCVLVIVILGNTRILQLPQFIENSFMMERITSKFNRFFNGNTSTVDEISMERGWFLLKDYWYMMLYGAGEGAAYRFLNWGGEVHSSIFAPLFYYGIVPFSTWLSWCYKQIHGTDKSLYCIYLALFVESLTLVNTRQPFFWMLLVFAGLDNVGDMDTRRQKNEITVV